MQRESYYQSLENPTQCDRLPPTRPELEFRLEAYSDEDDLEFASAIAGFWLMIPVTAGAAIHFTAFIVDSCGPYSFWLRAVFTVAAVLALVHLLRDQRGTCKSVTVPLCLTVWLHTTFSLPLSLLGLTAAVLIGLLSFRIGNHWGALCTASPLDRNVAQQQRQQWQSYLTVMSALPAVIVSLAIMLRSPAIAVLGVLTVVGYQLISQLLIRPDAEVDLPLFAWVSWLTYDRADEDIPGVIQSPAGRCHDRWMQTCAPLLILSLIFFAAPIEVLAGDVIYVFGVTPEHQVTLPLSSAFGIHGTGLTALLSELLLALATSLLLLLVWPVALTLPVLQDAARYPAVAAATDLWANVVSGLRRSSDPMERQSVFIGRNIYDGSPLLVPRSVFREHGHFLGDSGSGKTALGLAPFIEQMFAGEDCSIIVLDLKADTLELYAAMAAAADERNHRTGVEVRLQHFTIESDRSTFAFNPLTQPFWRELEPFVKVDMLCGALGLEYGADYGAGYYSSANAAVLHETVEQFPDIRSLAEAAVRVRELLKPTSRKSALGSAREAGDHVAHVLRELAAFDQLNVTDRTGHPAAVVNAGLQLPRAFSEPSLSYFHLSSTLAPKAAPAIARLVTYSLLAAATRTKREIPVYLVIDEFQRMVAHNVEYILQLARSMGVGVILANQSLEDLQTSKTDLRTAIEANCRYRQWFSVSSREDRSRLTDGSGETMELVEGHSFSSNGTRTSTGTSIRDSRATRLSLNDILLLSDHPNQSAVQITRGQGYAQFGGMAVVVETPFHISRDEYERRRSMAWPAPHNGAFIPSLCRGRGFDAVRKAEGPVLTTEVIGASTPPEAKPRARSSSRRQVDRSET